MLFSFASSSGAHGFTEAPELQTAHVVLSSSKGTLAMSLYDLIGDDKQPVAELQKAVETMRRSFKTTIVVVLIDEKCESRQSFMNLQVALATKPRHMLVPVDYFPESDQCTRIRDMLEKVYSALIVSATVAV